MTTDTRLTTAAAHEALARAGGTYTKVFGHGTLEVKIYRPRGVDPQEPHDRDEVYVVISGSGWFVNGPKGGERGGA